MSDSYHSDFSHVSRSMLKLFRKSHLDYYLTYVTRELPPQVPSKPMLLGTILHAVLLEDRKLDDLVMCYPGDCINANGGLIGTRAAAFREKYPDWVCLKQEELDCAANAIKSVLRDADIRKVLESATSKEERFDAELDGTPCKCRPDIAANLDYVVVYDLKFSLNVDPDSWKRTSRNLALWLQDAHYSRVLATRFDKPVQFRFCNVEVKRPHRIQWYWYPPAAREMAFGWHRSLMVDLKKCRDSGEWHDDWKNETELSPWDFSEDEMTEVPQ